MDMNVIRRSGDGVRGTLLLAALGALLLVAPAANAQDQNAEGAGFSVFSGRATFRSYCASCHGSEALGDGNVAQYLRVQPANLTLLSSRNAGEFPAEEMRQYIDGRKSAPGHGTREMPVWGDVFQSTLADPQGVEEDGEERADRIIGQLVKYLESIQVTE